MRFLLRILAAFPLWFLHAVSSLLAVIIGSVVRWRRAQIDRDLELAFPERSAEDRRAIRNDSYRRVTDLFFEMVWGARAGADQLAARVRFDNPEIIDRYVEQKLSVVLLAPHYCNWEWLLLAGGATFGFPIDAVYQPQRLSGLDRFLYDARSRFGGKPIAQRDFVYELMHRAGEARGYALIADQTPRPEDRKVWTRFLNRDTAFFVGAEKVAHFLGAPVLYVGMRRLSRGRYAVRFTPLAEPPYDDRPATPIMEGFARCLESAVRAAPADWLWLQKRWKYPRPAGE